MNAALFRQTADEPFVSFSSRGTDNVVNERANLDFSRSIGPYRLRANGIGIIRMAMNPISVDAQRGLSESNI